MEENQLPKPTISNVSAKSKKKIMIVEDDYFMRDLYSEQCDLAGYEVVTATDGQHALAIIKNEMPDLMLIDLMLPKVDGLSLLKTIKSNSDLKHIPCIILTNLEDSAKKKEVLDAGGADYLLKIRNTPKIIAEKLKYYF